MFPTNLHTLITKLGNHQVPGTEQQVPVSRSRESKRKAIPYMGVTPTLFISNRKST